MNAFEENLNNSGHYPLIAKKLDTFVVNFGLRYNPRSMHYYAEALNNDKDDMSLETMERVLGILKDYDDISLVEITGTSPEINPHFKHFIRKADELGKRLAVVSNPAVYTDPGMEDMPEFLAQYKVKLLSFVPHYNKDIVDACCGTGTYDKIVTAFKKINSVGYSKDGSDLTTAFVYLPAKPEIAADRDLLFDAYRNEYKGKHNIDFNHFIIFNTIPIGRFDNESYKQQLRDTFNPDTIKNLPCSHALSIAPDGRFFDCDFAVAADRPVKSECADLNTFDYIKLRNRKTAVDDPCHICTSGIGATCADCFT